MATKKVTLDPGESREVAFSFTLDVAKVYVVSINGLTGHFRAIAVGKGYFTISPEWLEVNSNKPEYEATFTVTNTGDAIKTEKVQWWVMEGYTVLSGGGWTITLSPRESKEYSIPIPHPGYTGDRHARFRTEEMDGVVIVHFY